MKMFAVVENCHARMKMFAVVENCHASEGCKSLMKQGVVLLSFRCVSITLLGDFISTSSKNSNYHVIFSWDKVAHRFDPPRAFARRFPLGYGTCHVVHGEKLARIQTVLGFSGK